MKFYETSAKTKENVQEVTIKYSFVCFQVVIFINGSADSIFSGLPLCRELRIYLKKSISLRAFISSFSFKRLSVSVEANVIYLYLINVKI